ncbi:MAG: hypothetical protein ACRC4W_06040 [Treponemataceae bacterium]
MSEVELNEKLDSEMFEQMQSLNNVACKQNAIAYVKGLRDATALLKEQTAEQSA